MTDQPGSTRGTTHTQQLEIERRILRARTAAMDAGSYWTVNPCRPTTWSWEL